MNKLIRKKLMTMASQVSFESLLSFHIVLESSLCIMTCVVKKIPKGAIIEEVIGNQDQLVYIIINDETKPDLVSYVPLKLEKIEEDIAKLLVAIPEEQLRLQMFKEQDHLEEAKKCQIGDVVQIRRSDNIYEGVVRYKGEISKKFGTYFGIELFCSVVGSSDGVDCNCRLFTCEMGSGIFASMDNIIFDRNINLDPYGKISKEGGIRNYICAGYEIAIKFKGKEKEEQGTVMFVGRLPGNPPSTALYVGINLKHAAGCGTGVYRGVQLFDAPLNHAKIVRLSTPMISNYQQMLTKSEVSPNQPSASSSSNSIRNFEILTNPHNRYANSNQTIHYSLDSLPLGFLKLSMDIPPLKETQSVRDSVTGSLIEVGTFIQIDPYNIFSRGLKLNNFFLGIVRWLGIGPANESFAGVEINKQIPGIGDGIHEDVRYFKGICNRSLLLPTSTCYPDKKLMMCDEKESSTPVSCDEIIDNQANTMLKILNTHMTLEEENKQRMESKKAINRKKKRNSKK